MVYDEFRSMNVSSREQFNFSKPAALPAFQELVSAWVHGAWMLTQPLTANSKANLCLGGDAAHEYRLQPSCEWALTQRMRAEHRCANSVQS